MPAPVMINDPSAIVKMHVFVRFLFFYWWAILIFAAPVLAQIRPDTAWTRVVGQGIVSEQCHNIFETSDDGIITIGVLQDGPEGPYYGIIHRLSVNGHELWSRRQFGWAHGWPEASLLVDDDILVAAGRGASSDTGGVFISALNGEGDTLWYREIPQRQARAFCIVRASDGGYAVGGTGTPHDPYFNQCAFLYRFDENGNFLWSAEYLEPELTFIEAVEDLAALNDGGFMLVAPQEIWYPGYARGTRIIRVNNLGDTTWVRVIHHATETITLKCIEPLADSTFLLAGYQGIREGGGDLFLGKIDLNGTMVWDSVYNIYTIWYWQDANLAVCRDGGWVVAATHRPNTIYDYALLMRFNAYGDTLWSWTIGWEGGDNTGRAVTALSDGGFALAGDSWEYIPEGWRIWTLVVRTEPEESSVSTKPALSPGEFELEPVYPNPFNAAAAIEFTLKRPAVVRLCLYDLLGREAAIVYDGWTPAGNHCFPLHAENLASGEYFLRGEASGIETTQKIALIK